MLDVTQRERRRSGLGSSDVAAVAGLSPFSDALKVYMDKVGLLPPRPNTRVTEAGHRLEEAVARWAADRRGWQIRRHNRTVAHRRQRWMLATPDFEVVEQRRRRALLECKTANAPSWIDDGAWGVFGEDGTDEVPKTYRCQVQWQMSVLDVPVTYLAALFFRTRELRIYRIEYSRELHQALVDICSDFWQRHVIAGEPPELDPGASRTHEYLASVLRMQRTEVVDAPAECGPWAEQLARANEQIRAAKEAKAEAEAYLKAYTGADRGLQSWWGRFLWFEKAGGIDYKGLVQHLADELNLSEDELAELRERYRRDPTRQVRFTPARGLAPGQGG